MQRFESGGNYINQDGAKIYFGKNNNADKNYILNCLENIQNMQFGGFEVSRIIDDSELFYITLRFEDGKYLPTLFCNETNSIKTLSNVLNTDLMLFQGEYFPKAEITTDFLQLKQIFSDYYDFGKSEILDNQLN